MFSHKVCRLTLNSIYICIVQAEIAYMNTSKQLSDKKLCLKAGNDHSRGTGQESCYKRLSKNLNLFNIEGEAVTYTLKTCSGEMETTGKESSWVGSEGNSDSEKSSQGIDEA